MASYYPTTYSQQPQPFVSGYPSGYPSGYGQTYVPSAGGVVVPQAQYVPPMVMGTPVVMAPTGYGYPHHPYSLGARLRRFFGFAPPSGYRYRSDHDTWGFMGYSRRQRYIDARTGGEVDRQGRPVFRV